ncbi:MAG: glycogen debranching enzyme, partial [Actinomycetota bacterium]|nr:glycogen debranching enzyme [Actinomycetota bacterium]
GGDEMGRTQGGNNNAYCQDNEVSWFDWDAQDGTLVAYVSRLIDLRRHHPVFRRRRWFEGRPLHGTDCKDLAWFRSDGTEMSDEDWSSGRSRSIGVFLNGDAIASVDERGEPIVDDSFLIVFNAHHQPIEFTLPAERFGDRWVKVLDTYDSFAEGEQSKAGESTTVGSRSLVLLRRAG